MTAPARPRTNAVPTKQEFSRRIHAFNRGVNRDRHVPAVYKQVGVLLADCVNRLNQGGAYWAIDTIADELGISNNTVLRAVDCLERYGHLQVIRGKRGRGYPNRYFMTPDELAPARVVELRKPRKAVRKRCSTCTFPEPGKGAPKRCTGCAPESLRGKEEALRASSPSPGERLPPKSGGSDDPFGGRAALRAAAPKSGESKNPQPAPSEPAAAKQSTPQSPPPSAEPAAAGEVVALDAERGWRELRAKWRRGHATDDTSKAIAMARQAYAKALAGGARPADILAGAERWVAAADAPRYLPSLINWLDAGGWRSPPPTKAKSRHTTWRGRARGQADDLPRTNGNKVNMGKLALKMGGYVEADDGSMHHPDGTDERSIFWGVRY